jgi:hypothetical protein
MTHALISTIVIYELSTRKSQIRLKNVHERENPILKNR